MRKLKTLGKSSDKEDVEEDDPDESCSLSSQGTKYSKKSKKRQNEGLRNFWVWEKRARFINCLLLTHFVYI